ncbi:hypothetical protein [Ornithinimicrobium cryptoxanthini]|uniref:Uncharacterized protein n=1 Tax=Ornithinimicrobium cryptoxanthini TaxID=2934161 RepID=A0ABY4YKU3_9MICO|nr:hypothetical protein [Ornithinimicrobium cryptoxanthini]USQ77341.1 hypothetical protein NF557_05360 [Ornithinimicrobium cryptoxanthini]
MKKTTRTMPVPTDTSRHPKSPGAFRRFAASLDLHEVGPTVPYRHSTR